MRPSCGCAALGRHLLLELYGCDRGRLDDEEFVRAEAVAAARAMGATVISAHSHRFHPVGVSVVVILAESHLSIHTWPEHATASADVFVCSPASQPHRAKQRLADALGAGRVSELDLPRGRLEPDEQPAGEPRAGRDASS